MATTPPDKSDQSDGDDFPVGSIVAVPAAVYFRELLVDFLATLIPGLWFVAATVPAIVLPVFWLVTLVDGDSNPQYLETIKALSVLKAVEALSKATSAFHLELFLFVLSVSFLIGHLMFRQDLERPDKFSWIMANLYKSDYCKLCIIFRWIFRTMGTDLAFTIKNTEKFDGMVRPTTSPCKMSDIPVQFPYSHLKNYLDDRGFTQLADMVTWEVTGNNSPSALPKRTKNFINDKKAFLEFYFPQQIRELSRIEGHIRLHSSLWYACYYLIYISIVGLAIGFFANYILWVRFNYFDLEITVLPFGVYIVSFFFQHLIENAFHYQRTREVFYVLKLTQLAENITPKSDKQTHVQRA